MDEVPEAILKQLAEWQFIFFIFSRLSGMLLVSPLLSNKSITGTIRFFLAAYIALLLSLALIPLYQGPNAAFRLPRIYTGEVAAFLSFGITTIKEVIIGYSLGYIFNIVFESMMLAGEMIDSMIGYSAAQFFDPISNTFQSYLGQLLLLFGALVMLILDFHHVFIRVVAESFYYIPIGEYTLSPGFVSDITTATSWIFVFAYKFGAIPIVILACGLVGIAFTVRVVPEMNLLYTGLPMRILIGLYTVMMALSRILPVFEESLERIAELAEHLLKTI